jgi:hypothetical protein
MVYSLWVMKFWNSRNLRWVHASRKSKRRECEGRCQYIRGIDRYEVLSEQQDELEIVRAYEIGLQLPPSKTSSNVTFSKAFDPNLFASPSRIGM